MSFVVGQHNYGQTNIQFMLIDRDKPQHQVRRLRVDVELRGDFAAAYSDGDNSPVLTTNAMDNTVRAFAQQHRAAPVEVLASSLAQRFLSVCPAAQTVEVKVAASDFEPIELPGQAFSVGFVPAGQEQKTAFAQALRGQGCSITSGLSNIELFLTTRSMFKNFLREKYTTTPGFEDRVLGMKIDAQWFYGNNAKVDFVDCGHRARQAILETFAAHTSFSSQHTCYVLAEAVLRACQEVERTIVSGVHQKRLLTDMTAYGYDNPGQIYEINDAQATPVAAEAIRTAG